MSNRLYLTFEALQKTSTPPVVCEQTNSVTTHAFHIVILQKQKKNCALTTSYTAFQSRAKALYEMNVTQNGRYVDVLQAHTI